MPVAYPPSSANVHIGKKVSCVSFAMFDCTKWYIVK